TCAPITMPPRGRGSSRAVTRVAARRSWCGPSLKGASALPPSTPTSPRSAERAALATGIGGRARSLDSTQGQTRALPPSGDAHDLHRIFRAEPVEIGAPFAQRAHAADLADVLQHGEIEVTDHHGLGVGV